MTILGIGVALVKRNDELSMIRLRGGRLTGDFDNVLTTPGPIFDVQVADASVDV
jgi:hypothetical protein